MTTRKLTVLDGLRFPYVPVTNTRGEGALRPQIPMTLTYRGKSLQAAGLLDTGADVNVLPYQLGIALGAIWDEQSTTVELSGNFGRYEARGIIITTTIGNFEPVRLVFAWTQVADAPLLLGQINFFAEFDVCFYGAPKSLEVRPKSSL